MRCVDPCPPRLRSLKDPRFCVTLGAWRPALRPATSFVAVVRNPAEVAMSLAAMARRDPTYYDGFEVTPTVALALWAAAARRVLRLRRDGRWFVVDHASLLNGSAVVPLGRFVGRGLDPNQVKADLHRSRSEIEVGDACLGLAADLGTIAAADLRRWRSA